MVIRELTEQECYAMIAGTRVARLACARNNQPYIIPLHVGFKAGLLYGFATLGQKIEWMRQNPLVCLEIDELTSERQWATVILFGYYEELPSTPGHDGSRAIAHELFERHPAWWEPASIPIGSHDRRAPIVFRIQITHVSGRRATPEFEALTKVENDERRPSGHGWLTRILSLVAQKQ